MSVISKRPFFPAAPFVLAAALIALVPVFSSAQEVLYEQKMELPTQITVPATIARQTYTFILDTGCAVQCLDPALENLVGPYRYSSELATNPPNLDLLKASTMARHGAVLGQDVSLKICDAPPTSIGTWKMPPSQASVFDLQPMRELLGLNIRGIFGPNEFKENAVLLDFEHATLKVMRGRVTLPSDMQSLKLGKDPHHLPMIKPELNGQETEFLIDTGNSGCICLRHDLFAALVAGGAIEQDLSPDPTQTMLGTVLLPHGTFTKGHLLGVDLTGIPVEDNGEMSSLGMAFLLNFNVLLDFKGGTFSYQRRRALPPILPHKMLGAALKFSGGHNHIFILDPHQSAARDAGLQIWDRITRLGPLREPDLNYVSLYQLCLDRAGETVEVEVLRPGVSAPIDTFLNLPEKQFNYPPRTSK